jgi:hypothetical protein
MPIAFSPAVRERLRRLRLITSFAGDRSNALR